MNHLSGWQDTIVAPATAPGVGAIAVIRLSGKNSLDIANKIFLKKDLKKQKSHTAHFGDLSAPALAASGEQLAPEIIDEVLVTVFKNPHSYTGEDVVEISCHGSPYIQQQILNACTVLGARLAKPGEFTQRAFLNGKLDLTQAEAVSDLIAANSKAAQQTALNQLRGGFKNDLAQLREELINFAALIELELDFSDEDVEFADRQQFKKLIAELEHKISALIHSFRLGNAIKNGISVAIIGKPNAGKSTLLNALLNEERAIVSEIAGTTRDTIEEVLHINGAAFRFIDTAGIRDTTDHIESIGVKKAKEKIATAKILLYLYDEFDTTPQEIIDFVKEFKRDDLEIVLVRNKIDLNNGYFEKEFDNQLGDELFAENLIDTIVGISAKNNVGIEALKQILFEKGVGENIALEDTIVTNVRHHAALQKIYESIAAVEDGMAQNIPGDLLTTDIRRALHYLGEITGRVEIDRDILGTIFGKFCIGK